MVDSPLFDVFLCHNSKDKPEVIEIARQLKQRRLNPWLDEWELRPGLSWQELLEEQIEEIKTAAVFVGSSGLGPWQKREMRAFLSEFVERNCPVIPVLLKSAPKEPRLPIFLRGMTYVDFRRTESKPLARLSWGITGIKPDDLNLSLEEVTKKDSRRINNNVPSLQIPTESASIADSQRVQSTSFPIQQPLKLQIERFEIITVDARGKEIARKPLQAEYFSENLGDGVTLDMVAIPGGQFFMGTDEAEIARLNQKYDTTRFNREQPQHKVTVPPFFMGKYPITQIQWRAIASRSDLKVKQDLDPDPAYFKDQADGDRRPVEQVSWYDAVEFCQRLSKLTPIEYRLPSEAQWEYACRAVNAKDLTLEQWNQQHHQPFYFGETITADLANYNGNYTYAQEPTGKYRKATTPVGNFPPNAFDLYDLHGNVWEWCADNWHDNYDGAPNDGSVWLENGNDNRSPLRGGSWVNLPYVCRSAFRVNDIWGRDFVNSVVGFRVCSLSIDERPRVAVRRKGTREFKHWTLNIEH
ncbi:MAG: SUMF1/EgtB/PvdO family nonheme iron enzyme [Cyanobacteria bacterium J06621_8]